LVAAAQDDTGVATMDFYVSPDGGTTWTAVQEGFVPPSANGVSVPWAIPADFPLTANLMVRVVARDASGNWGDRIAGPYVVKDGTAPIVTILYPNGGEAVPAGSTQQFRWMISAPNGLLEADLSLWYNNSYVSSIDVTTNTNGLYSWALPANVTSNMAKIQVQVTDRNGNKAEAWSAGPFSIVDNSQPPPAPWQASNAVTSAGTGDSAGVPRIVADKFGNLHLIYGLTHDGTAHTVSFRYRKRNGTTWTSPSLVSFDVSGADGLTGSSYQIGDWSFATDSNGFPHLTWATSYNFMSEQNKNDIFYSCFDGSAWSTPRNLSSTIRGQNSATTLTWVRKADIPSGSSNPIAAAAVGSKLYYVWYDQLYQFDPASNNWTTKAAPPGRAVDDGGIAVLNGLIYVAGNVIDGNVRIYNPSSNSWSTGAAMPSPQQGVRLAAANGKIYAIDGGGGTMIRKYDPAGNSWSTVTDMPTGRSYPAVTTVGTKIYVIGGYDQQSMDIYDAVNDSWTTRNYPFAANIPLCYGGFACAANNKIYFFPGGQVNYTDPASHDVWEYDPATNGWMRMLLTQFAHHCGGGAVIGSKIYALGGTEYSTALTSMEEATLSTDTCGASSEFPLIAVDGNNSVHVLWRDGTYWQPDGSSIFGCSRTGTWNVFESVKSGSAWSSPTQVTTGGTNRHGLAADQAGNLHLAYYAYDGTINYRKTSSGVWSSPMQAGSAASLYGLDLAVDSLSAVRLIYSGYDSQSSSNLLRYVTLNGSAWSSPETIGVINSGFPARLFLDSLNRPHAVWGGGSGSPAVWYSTRNGNAWVAPIQLNRASENPVGGSVDGALFRTTNELNVVWQCANSGNPNVLVCSANVGSSTDIFPPSVVVTSPVAGGLLSIGASTAITWSASDNVGVSAVDLDYSMDGGTTWKPIATGQPNTGSYSWTTANASSIRIRVKAYDPAGNIGVGFSGSIPTSDTTPPSIVMTAPSGSLAAGSPVDVKWTATDNVGVIGIDLDYSMDNGTSWASIATGLANTGSHSWTLPSAPSNGFVVRATAHDDASLASTASTALLTLSRTSHPPLVAHNPFPLANAENVPFQSPTLQWSSGDMDGDSLT